MPNDDNREFRRARLLRDRSRIQSLRLELDVARTHENAAKRRMAEAVIRSVAPDLNDVDAGAEVARLEKILEGAQSLRARTEHDQIQQRQIELEAAATQLRERLPGMADHVMAVYAKLADFPNPAAHRKEIDRLQAEIKAGEIEIARLTSRAREAAFACKKLRADHPTAFTDLET